MNQIAKAVVVAAGLLSLAGEAQAQQGAYMWGVGIKLGTGFIPGQYPVAFPSRITNYDFLDEETSNLGGATTGDNKDRDLDSNGEPRFSTLQRVGFDGRLGMEGFYGIDAFNRVGAGFGVGLGQDYFDGWFTVNYDRVFSKKGDFAVIGGAQVGYGSARWDGDEDLPGGENEYLRIPYYPLRARAQAQFMGKSTLFGAGLFVQDAIPARTVYVDLDGVEQPKVGGFGNFLLNWMIGVEMDLQFGDFTPPKAKPPKDKGKGKGKGKA